MRCPTSVRSLPSLAKPEPAVFDLLVAVGWRPSLKTRAGFVACFLCATAVLLVVRRGLASTVEVGGVLATQVVLWALWFFWQARLFPAHRERLLHEARSMAYRRAFFRDIWPGAAGAIALMLSPLVVAETVGGVGAVPMAQGVVGTLLVLLGLALLCGGLVVLGLARALFLDEYRRRPPPVLTTAVYRRLRHPMFAGAALASFGTGLLMPHPDALAVAAVNLLTLPVYRRLEDARLVRVFGSEYRSYSRSVHAFLPVRTAGSRKTPGAAALHAPAASSLVPAGSALRS